MVYHFLCDLTFATQQTGLGQCPKSITMHVPLFTETSFHYVPWQGNDNNILTLHYKSLNISPPLRFDFSTINSLDETYRLPDGQLTNRLASLKRDVSHLHTTHTTTLNDWLTCFAFILTLLNSVRLCLFHARKCKPLPRRPTLSSRSKHTAEHCSPATEPLTTDATAQELQTILPAPSTSDTPLTSPICYTCFKPGFFSL